jgi:adenine deaminase
MTNLTPQLAQFLSDMPKAELHIHIEGSLEPELIFALAKRNHVSIPFASVEQLRKAYDFSDLQTFLDIYYAGASVLLTEQDFFDMTAAYLRKAASENVRRAELFFDPQTHTARGVDIGVVFAGLTRAIAEVGAETGISAALILCFLRHLSEAEGFATLEAAMPYRSQFIGVGLDSSEMGHPPEKFTALFDACRELGLHIVAHAGEEGPPAYIESALDNLRVERIDHGVRILESTPLTQRVRDAKIALTVCPLSNIKLCVFKTLAEHNLKQLLDAGLKVTINSDDPAYFGGYLLQNFVETFAALDLQMADAYTLARNSLEASFAAPLQISGWLVELDRVYAAVAHQ